MNYVESSWITENIEVSSGRCYGLDIRPLDKLERRGVEESILGYHLHLHISKINFGLLKPLAVF